MSREEIIDKIKKLLRMKRGGTAGEIENALAMAAKLAREHGINLDSVNPDDESKAERITHEEFLLKLGIPTEARYAALICLNFFNVQICTHNAVRRLRIRAKITFVGTAWDIQIAQYVLVFLQHAFRRAWRERENRRLKNREAFMNGMFLGLAVKLEEERTKEPGVGLIKLDQAIQLRKDYLAKLFPNSKAREMNLDDSDASAAKRAGVEAGQNTHIRSALKKSDAPGRAALPALARPPAGQLQLI